MNNLSPHHAPPYVNMLLNQLYTNGIQDEQLLAALAETPRENFVPPALRGVAYVDEDIEIAPGRFLLAPLTFARLVNFADITKDSNVLIIAGGNGYAASVVSKLARWVVNVESEEALLAAAKKLSLGNVHHEKTLQKAEGFDVVLINGAVSEIPESLLASLKDSGRLVAIKQETSKSGKGVVVNKQGVERVVFDAVAPLLPGFGAKKSFRF
jgi:protein-L-isoaspartate(D-aspartate) O-methyltransferase